MKTLSPAAPVIADLEKLTQQIVSCAVEVHRVLGPGLPEEAYESAMCVELDSARLKYVRQHAVPVMYKGATIGEYRIDLLVENAIIVELAGVGQIDPMLTSQMLTYLNLTGNKVGLLINFNARFLRDGIRKFII
jgi:GxxExxY protein